MAFRVKIMPRAERDLAAIYRVIGESKAARAWYQGLKDGIRSLLDNPHRSPVSPEDTMLKHWLYGSKPHVYRVIYRVLEGAKRVEVLHIRHGAMDAFVPSERKREQDQPILGAYSSAIPPTNNPDRAVRACGLIHFANSRRRGSAISRMESSGNATPGSPICWPRFPNCLGRTPTSWRLSSNNRRPCRLGYG